MSSNFQGKVVTVTGGASGIGRATAVLLASRGANVSLCDVQKKQLDAVVEEIQQAGGTVIGVQVDVRDRAAVESWIRTTVETFGKIDGVANIAGVTGKDLGTADIANINDDDWDFVFDVNVKGIVHCLRAQVPNMNDGGSIVNVSSLSGVLGFPRHYAYNASKHAVMGITKCAAKELAPRKIRVNTVAP
jgi:NAD(P)-dependent dehydrogenase (short-subunit alcohol dehydrogenase family)